MSRFVIRLERAGKVLGQWEAQDAPLTVSCYNAENHGLVFAMALSVPSEPRHGQVAGQSAGISADSADAGKDPPPLKAPAPIEQPSSGNSVEQDVEQITERYPNIIPVDSSEGAPVADFEDECDTVVATRPVPPEPGEMDQDARPTVTSTPRARRSQGHGVPAVSHESTRAQEPYRNANIGVISTNSARTDKSAGGSDAAARMEKTRRSVPSPGKAPQPPPKTPGERSTRNGGADTSKSELLQQPPAKPDSARQGEPAMASSNGNAVGQGSSSPAAPASAAAGGAGGSYDEVPVVESQVPARLASGTGFPPAPLKRAPGDDFTMPMPDGYTIDDDDIYLLTDGDPTATGGYSPPDDQKHVASRLDARHLQVGVYTVDSGPREIAEVWFRQDGEWIPRGTLQPEQHFEAFGGVVKCGELGGLAVTPGPRLTGKATLPGGQVAAIRSGQKLVNLPPGSTVILWTGDLGFYVRSNVIPETTSSLTDELVEYRNTPRPSSWQAPRSDLDDEAS